jgi:hypothetical protein
VLSLSPAATATATVQSFPGPFKLWFSSTDEWWKRITGGKVMPVARMLETAVQVFALCAALDDQLQSCQDVDSNAAHAAALSTTLAAAPAAAVALFQVSSILRSSSLRALRDRFVLTTLSMLLLLLRLRLAASLSLALLVRCIVYILLVQYALSAHAGNASLLVAEPPLTLNCDYFVCLYTTAVHVTLHNATASSRGSVHCRQQHSCER